MKEHIRVLAQAVLKNDFIWSLLYPIRKFAEYIQYQRNIVVPPINADELKINREIETILGSSIVRNGLFKGMKYPYFQSYGSTIFPKIIGSYEKEVEHIIAKINNNQFETIVDIGCAEGYYAVGLAIKNPNSKIYAIDVDEKSISFCKQMAELNNVLNIEYLQHIDESFFATQMLEKTFILCDCEGYEKKLFTTSNIFYLKNTHLLIEIHDCVDIDISDYIADLFKDTHNIEIIRSVDDIYKAKYYEYPEVNDLPLKTKLHCFAEKRPGVMEWYYLSPKND